MGRQTGIPSERLELGDMIEVRHKGGARWRATWLGFDARKTRGRLDFGNAGVRQFHIEPCGRKPAGAFTTKRMRWWFVDVGTLDRVRAFRDRKKGEAA